MILGKGHGERLEKIRVLQQHLVKFPGRHKMIV
jgi:hypothetical protein